MKKRFLSLILTLAMVVTMLPMQAFAATQNVSYSENSSRNATITVQDANGNRINGATLTITRSTLSGNTYVYEYAATGDGQYTFTRNTTVFYNSFTITVEAAGYESKTVTMSASSSNTVVELTALETVEDEFAEVKVFYIADGRVPDTYQGAGDAADYGPSANNTPLVLVNVNLTKLRQIAQQDNSPVVYGTNTTAGNEWEFVPAGNRSDADFMENVKAFWAAVVSCMDEDSVLRFEETGLYDVYMAYCLKKQGDGSIHSDGILSVVPPVYVVELYQNQTYFGGGVTDQNGEFLTAYDILDQYEAHLKKTITWEEDQTTGKPIRHDADDMCAYPHYTGTYIDTDTNKIHTIWAYQYGSDGGIYPSNSNGTSEIPYVRQTDTYYLAQFNMKIDAGTPINYLITYTDGIDTEDIFYAHEYNAKKGDTVPAFTGVTSREDHTFLGWYLEGDDTGKIYSDADIAQMTVMGNMVFHAVWSALPKYTATVKVVLNGTYNPTTQTLTSGSLVDADTVFEDKDDVMLYLSADGGKYHTLGRVDTGVYSTTVKNGVYHVYYGEDGEYFQFADQAIIIENADRTRYLFFNSVTYNPNGGLYEGSRDIHTEYHYSGNTVNVCYKEPTREGYIFLGWKDLEGNILQPNQLLTDSISRAYELTAQWAEAVDVYVEVEIHHEGKGVDSGIDNKVNRSDITFTVDSRETGSTGDYTELNSWTIAPDTWEKGQTTVGDKPVYDGTNENHITRYIPQSANLTGVRGDMEYTVTTNKSGYTVESIEKTPENGKLTLKVVLVHDPESADLTYHVKLDEEAKKLNHSLWPAAVNVKVTSWYDSPYVDGTDRVWSTITQMHETYERIALNASGEGSGTYPVWIWDSVDPYRYRIEVVSYELQDGTIVTADDLEMPNEQYVSENKRYFADIVVENGEKPTPEELPGAYFADGVQQGTITAIVSIPAYTVTLNPNGGTLNGTENNTVLKEQIIVPDISAYVPVREGGYLFEGWYLADAQGNMTDTQVLAGTALTADITLLAKWRDPITVNGMVTAAGVYDQENEDGSVTVQFIHPVDRVQTVTVLLQKRLPSGYYETVDQQYVNLDYTKEEYYFQKTEELLVPVGVGHYAFEQLPDDGTQYRIFILSANYHSTYQNEPDSVDEDKKLQYKTYYEAYDYEASLGSTDPKIATVNAHLHFEPDSFNLKYRVDATQIGEGFRPDSAEVWVTYDGDPAITDPSQWPVISQMVFGEQKKGDQVTLEGGIGSGETSVWKNNCDGTTMYDYGICVPNTTTDGVKTAFDPNNPYFTITYQAPAYYVPTTGEQSQLLIAYLTPKTYQIKYDANGGTIYGQHVTSHTWSKETRLTEVIPVRSGYTFGGWYLDEALTMPLDFDTIAASVAEDQIFYAKWTQVNVHLQVVIDHEDVRKTPDMERLLFAQLTSRHVGNQGDFLPVDGYLKTYGSDVWHTHTGDPTVAHMDIMEIPYIYTGMSENWDYDMAVSLEGHYLIDSYLYNQPAEGDEPATTILFKTGVEKQVTHTDTETVYDHYITVCLKYDPKSELRVIFHANNTKALCYDAQSGNDVFRTYYPEGLTLPAGENYSLSQNGTVPMFYDIPGFEYATHNEFIFKGWYDAPQEGNAVRWENMTLADATEDLHLYAHWIDVGTVNKEENDKKQTGSDTYHGYDLIGAQIRDQEDDEMAHYGNPGSGLRFITVLSEFVYNQIKDIEGNEAGAEYGFVVAKSSTARNKAAGAQDYTLQYVGENVNGVDTTKDYSYAKNMKCSGVVDHYDGDAYRLYTAVITYGSQQGAALEAAYATDFVARSYIRYDDANGLTRVHYNNYTGTQLYGGCSVSFAAVRDVVTGQ